MEFRRECDSCHRDLRQSRSAYCQRCDSTFDADGKSAIATCPTCGRLADANLDPFALICKHCLRATNEDLRPAEPKRQQGAAAALPVRRTEGSWFGARASSLARSFVVRRSQQTEEPKRPQGAEGLPKTTLTKSLNGPSRAERTQQPPEPAPGSASENNAGQLWRCIGCVCGNHEPDCFQLLYSEWSQKSLYCRDCKQPYSAFMWSNEMPRKQCPRCNGPNVEEDPICKGDPVIRCLNCKSLVSKRRFDAVSEEIREQCAAEDRAAGRQSNSSPGVGCVHCGCADVRLAITECDENPCVMQICDGCGSADFLAGWNRLSDRIGLGGSEIDPAEPQKQVWSSTPAGFEELTRCCGDLTSLHPVEDDPQDDLLICARCDALVSLRACKDTRVPQTVAALRKTLKGTLSSGKMGKPYRSVKVASLADLRPGDQLDFKRRFYSHHAIVEAPIPESGEISVIEYTGEVNRPTIMAFLRVMPHKACVKQSLLKFHEKLKEMSRVDYHSLDCFHPSAVLRRAKGRITEENYNLIASNCEHFANWAKANVSFSRQVEYFKETAKAALRDAVIQITDYVDDLPKDSSVRAAVTILQDMRAEMLRVLDKDKGTTSLRDFWCPIRLLIKWMIRGIPLAFAMAISSVLPKAVGCKLIWCLDGPLKPLAEKVADLLPDGDNMEKGGKSKERRRSR